MSLRPPVLAYHSVHPTRRGPLAVHPSAFERQMGWLADRGFRTTTLQTRLDTWKAPGQSKEIVLTFDDGYEDNLRFAEPILRRYGFTATVFVVAGLIGTADVLEPEWSLRRYGGEARDYQMLSWEQVGVLRAAGWTIGAHTMTHPWLTTVDTARLRWEVEESKHVIEHHIGRVVEFFCYPAGRFNRAAHEAVRSAGYRGAVVTPREAGVVDAPYTMWRSGIYGHDTLMTFRLKLSRAFTILRRSPLMWRLKARFNHAVPERASGSGDA